MVSVDLCLTRAGKRRPAVVCKTCLRSEPHLVVFDRTMLERQLYVLHTHGTLYVHGRA